LKFITCRRHILDKMLNQVSFYGKVLDVGGLKESKRGDFNPPYEKVESWEYANVSEESQPDYLCSAESIPAQDDLFDWIVFCEVLEHLENPFIVLDEIQRIIKKDGKFLISVPFLYPYHADPDDFQRWTKSKLEAELSKRNFVIEEFTPMGGIWCVVFDLFDRYLISKRSFFPKKFRKFIRRIHKLFLYWDKKTDMQERITSGFFIIARQK
jgi:SAM-dependent methyltransferase